uniref:DNA polymerase epsilon subunit n=1 Tax=Megaselia scalaris TaxID=36166 RepID=T1H0P7_MEGSC
MSDDLAKLKKKIISAFKLSGFQIRSDVANFFVEQLAPFDESDRQKWVLKITQNIQNQKLDSINIEKKHIEKAINDLNNTGLDEGESVFSVISAFDVPKFVYNVQNKKFERQTKPRKILGNPTLKSSYLRNRYAMLLQKTQRHELFSPVIIEKSTEEVKKFKLMYVENLLSNSYVKEAVVLGLFTQLTEGKFYIEDPTGAVPLDLSAAKFHSGFFCEGCFVLAEGNFDDGVLKDVRLDLPIVQEKLRLLFVGYDNCPPVAIVLMGPFSVVEKDLYKMKTLLTQLGTLTNGCNQLKKETDIVLVPSSDDPAAANILPRKGLPECLAEGLKKHYPRTILATNPCRLQYCTQQIVVFKMDLLSKFCRNTLHFPDTTNIDYHFARTLICQGTLTPINPIAIPVHWDFDDCLSLYPLPDLVVIGDTSQSFHTTQRGCTVLNTGSFIKSQFSFKVYVPSTRTIEDSEIPEDETMIGANDDVNLESSELMRTVNDTAMLEV